MYETPFLWLTSAKSSQLCKVYDAQSVDTLHVVFWWQEVQSAPVAQLETGRD